MMYNKSDLDRSMSELESLGLETPKLNELNDSYEVENLVDSLKQMLFVRVQIDAGIRRLKGLGQGRPSPSILRPGPSFRTLKSPVYLICCTILYDGLSPGLVTRLTPCG